MSRINEQYIQSAKTKIQKAKNNFEQRARSVHGEKYNYSKVHYKNAKTKVLIICNDCNSEFWQTPDSHLNKRCGCYNCGFKRFQDSSNKNKFKKDSLLEVFNTVHQNKYSYEEVPEIIINVFEIISIKCLEHNLFFKQSINSHKRGSGCPICGRIKMKNKLVFTKETFLKKLYDKYPIHLHQSNFDNFIYVNNSTKGEIHCNECKRKYEVSPNNLMNGCLCVCGSMSTYEKIIGDFLTQNNIIYEVQYKIHNCNNIKALPFDFAIFKDSEKKELLYLIEYDGQQHNKPIPYFGGQIEFDKLKYRDHLKNLYCENNHIKLIRISYKDNKNIEKILKQTLL